MNWRTKVKTAKPNWLFEQTQKLQDGTKPRKAKTHKEEAGITRPDITNGIQKVAAEIGGVKTNEGHGKPRETNS
jgi:hypothetical protein